MIKVKRVYDPPEQDDGARFLVERLWPRGVKKEALRLHGWLKEVAPSDVLRRWFGHDSEKWSEFRRRYMAELDNKPDAWRPILEAAQQGNVTLLFSARDTAHNNAVALKDYVEGQRNEEGVAGKGSSGRSPEQDLDLQRPATPKTGLLFSLVKNYSQNLHPLTSLKENLARTLYI